jgi:5-methylcytosine-specific restriction endonuclease McrA
MNKWNIPDWLESEVKHRDRNCVYCRITFGSSKETRKSIATWEHIVNDARIINRGNIARCCIRCNSSKGTKTLSAWLESDYCKKRAITKDTVAEVVRRALVVQPHIPGDGAS